jgi:hypothetical protein
VIHVQRDDHSTAAHDGEHESNQFRVYNIHKTVYEERRERGMRRYASFLVLVLGLTLLFSVRPAFSQTGEDYQALKKEVDGLKNDIQDLKRLLGPKPTAAAPKPAVAPAPEIKDAIINIKGAPIKGDKNAKLVWVEFSDYQ